MARRQIGFQLQRVDETGCQWHVPLKQQISAEGAAQTTCPASLFRCILVSVAGECSGNAIFECKLRSRQCCCPRVSVGTRCRWFHDSGLCFPPLCQHAGMSCKTVFKNGLLMRSPAWFTNLPRTRVRCAYFEAEWLKYTRDLLARCSSKYYYYSKSSESESFRLEGTWRGKAV